MNHEIESLVSALASLKQELGVISTIHADGKPEAAVVYFSSDENMNIYFTTRAGTRKYKNLLQNPHAAFVVYSENPPKTMQIEGTVVAITDPYQQTVLFSKLVGKVTENDDLPPIDKMPESEIMFMKLSPTWARMGDFELSQGGKTFEEATLA
jgi:general stress protein 26